jgi:uridine kinase
MDPDILFVDDRAGRFMNRAEMLETLALRIRRIYHPYPLRVAVDGIDAAGKTVLADALARRLQAAGENVIRASIDGFHNPRGVRHQRGSDSPEGYFLDSFDYAALNRLLLAPLGPGGDRNYVPAVYDYRTEASLPAATRRALPNSILIFDGVFLLRPELMQNWDFSIFIQADFETALRRAILRDRELFGTPEQVEARYRARYIPGQQLYLELCHPQTAADAVVANNDPEHPKLTLAPPRAG